MDVFPDNTLSDYTVKLDPPLNLNGNYEVGLCEITYPRSWLNVKQDEMYISMALTGEGGKLDGHNFVSLPEGHYDSVDNLIAVLNELIPQKFVHSRPPPFGKIPKEVWRNMFYYKVQVGKVQLTLPPKVRIHMSKPLAHVLGFKNQIHEGGQHVFADHVANINQNLGTLYVYISIIEDRRVGDTLAPLLRLVPLNNPRGSASFQSFHNIQFAPLKYTSFDRVTVVIRNGRGEKVAFEGGEVILTLQVQRQTLP